MPLVSWLETLRMLFSQAAMSIDNARLYENLEEKVDERTAQLKAAQEELVEKAHKAGMADVAISTLHNIGNILNSVKASAQIINDIYTTSELDGFKKGNALLRQNIDNIEEFISDNPKGKKLLHFYLALEKEIDKERDKTKKNMDRLIDKIYTMEQIVEAQRDYAGASPFTEMQVLSEIIDDALFTKNKALTQHKIEVLKNFQEAPQVPVQKAKLVHILINLIQNAIDSMGEFDTIKKKLSVSLDQDHSAVFIKIQDTGKGIAEKDLNRIFAYRHKSGENRHGVSLHNCANHMTEMKGSLWAESHGEGKGATFVMKLPK